MKQIGGFDDITPGRTLEGDEATIARVWHIVETPVGRLPQDPTWGWGLRRRLGTKTTAGDLKTEASIGREAIRKDPDVQEATVRLTQRADAQNKYRVEITLQTKRGTSPTIDRELST